MELGNIFDSNCTRCSLSGGCKNVCIAGVGRGTAKLMIVIETPAYTDADNGTVAQDEKEGLLRGVLEDVIKADMREVYITYLVKCRPIDGRAATKAEVNDCKYYLDKEIEIIKPKVVLLLGNASKHILETEDVINKLRDKIHTIDYDGNEIQTICTYSSAYAIRNENVVTNFAKDVHRAYNLALDVKEEIGTTQIVPVLTLDKVSELIEYVKETGVCTFDFETSGLDWYNGRGEIFFATMIAISFQAGSAWTIPLDHPDSPFSYDEVTEIMTLLEIGIFSNTGVRKIAHNAKFDLHIARAYGVKKFRGRYDDTMVMHHIWDETKKHGLKEIVREFLPKFSGYEDEVKKSNWSKIPMDVLMRYGGIDTDMTFRIAVVLEGYLLDDTRLYKLYRNLQMAFLKPAFEAEHAGMKIDRENLELGISRAKEAIESITERIKKIPILIKYEETKRTELVNEKIALLESKIRGWEEKRNGKGKTKTQEKLEQDLIDLKSGRVSVYEGLNFNSTPQLIEFLYTRKGCNYKKPFKDFTNKISLMELGDKTGFVDNLLLLRGLEKTVSTYLIGIRDRLDPNDYLHTSFNQHGTRTGRLSSSDPNLQNLPVADRVRNEEVRMVVEFVKQSFSVPSEDYYLFQYDYSQAELRIIAEFADEKNMLEAYNNNLDLHALTGSKLAGYKTIEEFYTIDPKLQKKYRTDAKAANFGLIYGMGEDGYREYAKNNYGVNMTKPEAAKSRNAFFELYPKLLQYHAIYIAKARKFGGVRTLFGRKRRTPDINSYDNYLRSDDERVAINSPVQGTSGEFTIFAIALLHLRLLRCRAYFRNTIHDSILFYIHKDDVELAHSIIKNTAENLPTMQYFDRALEKVSMKVDTEYTDKNWRSMQEFIG